MKKYDYVSVNREDVQEIPNEHYNLIKKFMRLYTRLNVWVYKKSNGRWMKNFPGGYPICIVKYRGRKTGKQREIALIHLPWEDKELLVASQGGMDKHPVWYYNIKANPGVEVFFEGVTKSYVAEQATEQQKRDLWPHLLSLYPDFDEYQARTDRDIPVFICSPS